jgi:peptide/nickel transport system substrate-binding protein
MRLLMRFLRPLTAIVLTLAAGAAAAKDNLVIGVAQFPASLHPYIGAQTVQHYVVAFAERAVSTFDNDGKPACLLCTELPTLENGLAKLEDQPGGGHGLAVTIKLKPDLKWGDGEPVTASDLRFTWQMGRDPANGFNNLYDWGRASSVDVVDAHTAVLHLPRTLTSFQMWDQLLPEHLERPIVEQGTNTLDYINHTLYNAAPTTPGLWNGPYVISAYHSGDSVELSVNPYWAGPKPAFTKIVIRLIENTAALVANLLSGDIDMTPQGIGITTDQAVALEHAHPGQFQFFYTKGLSYERIVAQKDNPALADLRVRQALLLSIDRETLIRRLFSGHATVALSWINANEPNYTEEVTHYGFDPKRASDLLREAGWTPGPDGICRNAAGTRLSFEFSTTSGNRVRELSQQVMQSQWKNVCVEVTIKNEPSRSFFGETMRKRLYQGLAEFASMTNIGLVPIPYYASSVISTPANNFSGQNRSAWANPEMDRLMAEAEVELDPAKQRTLWAAMQRLYTEQLPELPLYFRQDPDIVPIWMKGYAATGKETYESEWVEQWHP